ncbi:MAG: hypothetical protein EXS14_04125 [Planctomycetes bacterium]|nr:hypothetical protein [Planctomycetota bacterium]
MRSTSFFKRCALYGCGAAAIAVLLLVGLAKPEPSIDELMDPVFAQARSDLVAARASAVDLAERFPKAVKPALLAAFIAERNGDLVEAARWYSIGLERCTDATQRAEVLIGMADLARRGQRSGDAQRCFAEAKSLSPNLLRVRAFSVLQAIDEGRCIEALQEARSLAEEEHGSPMVGRLCVLAEEACRVRQESPARKTENTSR